ncbi:MAG: cation-transporting P-type ATPase [Hydrogenophilaceae bacterium]|nr:cation-transporting P-type ATPase [Hydrogenophilaceae bacterium]
MSSAVIEVVHAAVPGRVRLRVPGLYRNEVALSRLEIALATENGIRIAAINVLTATLLVSYDCQHSLADVLVLLGRRIEAAGLPKAMGEPASLRKLVNPTLPATALRPAAPCPATARQATAHARPVATRSASIWHQRSAQETLENFNVNFNRGLAADVAANRLARYGPNALPEPERRSDLAIFVDQFKSLPILLLGASAVLSAATGGLADAAVIMAVVLINAGIGYATEAQAERLISSLTSIPRPPVTVVREGGTLSLPAREVVPGDILLLTPGCLVAADARLIHVKDLAVDESALTGESLPVAKSAEILCTEQTPLADRLNMVHMGTAVTGGSAIAVVVATGPATEIGLIQALVGETRPPETPMQRQLDRLGNQLVWASLAICGGVFAMGLLRGYGFLPMLRAAVSLAVAAVPEGLPTVATTTLALGIRDMRRRKVLIRHLDAVETLGSVQVICLDKTGTLTVNRMSVLAVNVGQERLRVENGRFYSDSGRVEPYARPELLSLLHVAALCNESKLNGTNPSLGLEGSATENALLAMALAAGVDVAELRQRHPLLRTEYRSEGRSYMTTWHGAANGERLVALKGSPEQVLSLCRWRLVDGSAREIDDEFRDAIRMENERMAGEALRVLAFAYRMDGGGGDDGLVWLGLAGMADPIREGTHELIGLFHEAGIKTVMITGDQSATAYAIGKQLGLSGDHKLEILDSARLDRIEPELMSALAGKVDIFSRVSPANKLQIVQGLQHAGKVVAMTGDGINDGPALKAADIGVAMGSGGTEVARNVADVVLEDDNLQTMIVAVSQGRTIYSNIRKSIHYLVSSNMSEIGVTLVAVAAGMGQPLNTMQLLWINLLTDVFPALALAMDPAEPDVLSRPPRDPQESIIRRQDFKCYGVEAAALTAGALGAYGYGLMRYGPGPQASTLAFMGLTLGQLLHAISCRSETHGLFSAERLPPNRWLTLAVGGSAALQLGTVAIPGLRGLLGTTPVMPADFLVVAGSAGLPYLAIEAMKSRQLARSPSSAQTKSSAAADVQGSSGPAPVLIT